MKSPTLTSPSSPTGAWSDTGCCAIFSSAWMRRHRHVHFIGDLLRRGFAAQFLRELLCARQSLFMISIMWTGIADGAGLVGDAWRVMACRIHQMA